MKNFKIGIAVVGIMWGMNGCSILNTSINHNNFNKAVEEYKEYKMHKAMAVAMDNDGRYAMGYAFDYATQEKAKKDAIKHCIDSNNKVTDKVKAKCEIYAIDNEIVSK